MKILAPAEHAVYQRDRNDLAAIPIELMGIPNGAEVEARVLAAGRGEGESGWIRVGTARNGQVQGKLPGVATGGPYEVQVRAGDASAVVRDILVGDLFVLSGQSNMDGCGKLVDTEQPSRMVRCFYFDDRWDVAVDPLCWYEEAVDPVHWRFPEQLREEAIREERDTRTWGAGLGVRFGKEIYKRQGVPVGLLQCSHGGTSMDQWSPKKLKQGGKSLYGMLIRRVRACGTKVRAIIWYQGESDAYTEEQATSYHKNMKAFVEAIRKDLGQPRLPFVQVQLGPYYGDAGNFPCWNRIQTQQIDLEADVPKLVTGAAIDLELSDVIHVTTRDQKKLGARLACLAEGLVYGDRTKQTGPRFKGVKVSKDRMCVEVRFGGVNGSLKPSNGIWGFTMDCNGVPVAIPVRKLNDEKTVLLGLGAPLPEGAVLWYGFGCNPCVNLGDAAGLACPVFGPVEL